MIRSIQVTQKKIREIYDTTNENLNGYFKIEISSTKDNEGFCALKAKVYSFKPNGDKNIKTKKVIESSNTKC